MKSLCAADSVLLGKPIISQQVDAEQIRVLIRQLEIVVRSGIDGSVVEFGCYIGTTSLFIRRLLDLLEDNRAFHVYDSFEGLPAKTTRDNSSVGEGFQAGELAVSKKRFIREFQKADLKIPIVHKGWFGDLTDKDVPDTIAFAFLDGDFYESIRDSLRLVIPRMQAGGVVIIDDYAREALPGTAKAVHEQFRPEHIRTAHNLGIIHI